MKTLHELQSDVDTWILQHGVRYFSELTNMAVLTEEVGELSRLIAREYGEQSFKDGKKPENVKAAIADELADVLFVALCLANQMGIDLEGAFKRNMAKKTKRDSSRHHDNDKLS